MNKKICDAHFYSAHNIMCSECGEAYNCEDCIVKKLYEERKHTFHVGDLVKVVNDGESYTTYIGWFTKNNLSDLLPYYVYNHAPSFSGEYVVISIAEHESANKMLYAISDTTTEEVYLVNGNAIQRI